MNHIALFSNDTSLRDMLNQLGDCNVAYFSTELDTKNLTRDITLAVFDFDVVPLSLLDEWEQFPRLHLRKMAVASADNLDRVDTILERLDNYVVRPLTQKTLAFQLEKAVRQDAIHYAYFIRSEIGNPLTSITGYSNLMLSEGYRLTDEQTKSFLKVIRGNVQRASDMMLHYVDWVRIENQYGYHFDWYDIQKLINNSLESAIKKFDAKRQKLTISVADDIPAIYGDEYKILQVIYMLLDNACNYSHENTESNLKIFMENNNLLCEIKDNGVGIRPEVYSHVFEKLWYDYHRPKEASYGLGLSLYLCKQIIDMHGGKIWFESEVGVGTTFYFTLPLAE